MAVCLSGKEHQHHPQQMSVRPKNSRRQGTGLYGTRSRLARRISVMTDCRMLRHPRMLAMHLCHDLVRLHDPLRSLGIDMHQQQLVNTIRHPRMFSQDAHL